MLLFLVACTQLPDKDPGADDAGLDDSAGPDDADTAGDTDTSDDTDTAPDTDRDTDPATCATGWPDRAVAIDATCPELPAADWNLREAWRYDRADLLSPPSALAGRPSDDDGDGRITAADRMTLWIQPYSTFSYGDAAVLLDGSGAEMLVETLFGDDYRAFARVGDLDPARTGMEYGAWRYIYGESGHWTLVDAARAYSDTRLPSAYGGVPWLTDLEGDGAPEVLLGSAILDASSGRILTELPDVENGYHTIVADLDRDGVPEIVSEAADGVGIWHADGAGPVVCPVTTVHVEQQFTTLAIANLDADDDGEIVRADNHLLSICDADGTLLAEAETDSSGGAAIGVGELDGDPEPEIVLDYNGVVDGQNVSGIVVYDDTLAELWRRPASTVGWQGFHLADLDGDGRHEILVSEYGAFTILDGDGNVLASVEAGTTGASPPLVVDLDGDGLAEIVTTGVDPTVQVWENAAGGWAVAGAADPTSGADHHPGEIGVDGTIPAEAPWWLESNVWQGHAAPGTPQLGELSVSVEEVCAEDCGDDLYVTLYVENTGGADVEAPIAVLVERGDGPTMFEARLDPPLEAGTARAMELRVDPDDARHGLTFTVDPDGLVRECDETDNVVTWSDTPCP